MRSGLDLCALIKLIQKEPKLKNTQLENIETSLSLFLISSLPFIVLFLLTNEYLRFFDRGKKLLKIRRLENCLLLTEPTVISIWTLQSNRDEIFISESSEVRGT